MDESQFHRLANTYLTTIADILEEKDDKGTLDIELQDGVLTIITESNKTFVVSRHGASKQIWLSSPISGGLHFSHDGKHWSLADGRNLSKVLSQELEKLTQIKVELP
jgi:iron donor protein CyaY